MNTSYRPELVATARDLKEVKVLAEAGADAILVGHQKYGLRVTGDFGLEDIEQAVLFLHGLNKKIYVVTNAIFHNQDLIDLPHYFERLVELKVDGIVCGDPSVFPILDEMGKFIPVFWNPETLSTNFETLKFWQKQGIQRAILSNELALDAIFEIKQELELPIEIQIHGMTCIFQSKRKLVSNYYHHIEDVNNQEKYDRDKKLHLKEPKKEDTNYPVFEDFNGTHIMSNEDLCMIEHLEPLIDKRIDSLRINGILQSRSYNEAIVKLYREAIDLCMSDLYQYKSFQFLNRVRESLGAIKSEERKLGTGFYFKEQIY
ncbi:U32 family peptidase [Aquibacillus koreensis]|uniref:U32 family peptidase n=1 Tax=Aquibacillus koreensis TaxID=279446 RepID=A0A9X4AJM6_9BACI|nr:peptidase U32 family protein [Aquibacillus koreensis]MCT2536894.1 U32 family peptidase [Aquibacillus koreensis]MDC3421974.1 U32 family peptidase [Aquibacillus koreensis]